MWSRLAAARLRGLNLGLIYNREPMYSDFTFYTLAIAALSWFWFAAILVPLAWADVVFKNESVTSYCTLQSYVSMLWFFPSLLCNFDTYRLGTAAASSSRAARDAEVASLRADAAANGGRLSSLRLARALPALVGLDEPLAATAAYTASAQAGREEAAPAGAVLVAACALRATPRVVADGGGGAPAVVWEVPASGGGESGDGDGTALTAAAGKAEAEARRLRNYADSLIGTVPSRSSRCR